METKQLPKQRRVVIYMPDDQYNELRARLIMEGKTVSSWFREVVKEVLSDE